MIKRNGRNPYCNHSRGRKSFFSPLSELDRILIYNPLLLYIMINWWNITGRMSVLRYEKCCKYTIGQKRLEWSSFSKREPSIDIVPKYVRTRVRNPNPTMEFQILNLYKGCPETFQSSSIYARYAIYQSSQVADHIGYFVKSWKSAQKPL